MNKQQTIFLVKPYNPYVPLAPEEKIRYRYKIHDTQYAIVETVLNWGKPEVGLPIEDEDYCGFYLYNSFDEAMDFVRLIKEYNR